MANDSGDQRYGSAFGFPAHSQRPEILGEIHSRPFHLIETPRALVHLAFMTGRDHGDADREALTRLCRTRGVSGPDPSARHHAIVWGNGTLRWEQHTEFSTYAWDGPAPQNFGDELTGHPFGEDFAPPGDLITGCRLEIRLGSDNAEEKALATFDPTSLCFAAMDGGLARAATDFRQDSDGLTRILILDCGLGPARAGALAQRLIEIETYRTLAMLGLPEARRLSPQMAVIEEGLVRITGELRDTESSGSQALLDELIALAADLEADAAASLYRFGASRAYDEIVSSRLAVLGEVTVPGFETWSAFLGRRLRPAMRTCRSVEERQANLSRKLARAANLLRTRVDVELERQNRDLLNSMNRRARLQLRLQQTVEGLSVAAVSYYVVGLVNYIAKGAQSAGLLPALDPAILTALAVPPVALGLWWLVRNIRRAHRDD
jgi:uncharacterized membrane-anchored protein